MTTTDQQFIGMAKTKAEHERQLISLATDACMVALRKVGFVSHDPRFDNKDYYRISEKIFEALEFNLL